ncbi:ATP-binding protein [Actinomadura chokoriensis]|uniref:ATP-binding protein n=1 Tax=Actinomadura chokoriensis TaxID=454156 RepID=UPI00356A0803
MNQILNGGVWSISWLIASLAIVVGAESANLWLHRLDSLTDQPADEIPPVRRNTRGASPLPETARNSREISVPRQLPRPVKHFTDRTTELSVLDRLHREGADLVTVSGLGGVGKTAFAVHWAHLNSAFFPDGQLYVNLHGYGPTTCITAEDVLGNFLRALNVATDRIPNGLDAMAAVFRSEVSTRRTLIILDNVESVPQVRPLLPSNAQCMVLVTGRSGLKSLSAQDGAEAIVLRPLAESDALDLLRSVSAVESQRTSTSMTSLVRHCGFLPLTIRIAAEYIRGHDADFTDDLIGRLGDQRRRLTFFTDHREGGMAENVFSWSYESLPPEAARMFRLSGLHAGIDFSLLAAAAASGTSLFEARRVLSLLTEASLLEKSGEDRYEFHDLVKAYARERLDVDETADDRHSAAHRLIGFYLRTADNADRIIAPRRRHVEADPSPWALTFENPHDALGWCAAERLNLIAVIDQAVLLGFDEYAWKLPIALIYFFILHSHPTNRYNVALIAVAAARRVVDRYAMAWAETCVGGAALTLGRPSQALERFQTALGLCEEIDDVPGSANNLGNIAAALVHLERYDEALEHAMCSLQLCGDLDDARGAAIQLRSIASIHRRLGDVEEAYRHYEAAISTADGVDLQAKGDALQELGELSDEQENHAAAVAWFRRSLEIRRDIDDRTGIAATLLSLASPLVAVGEIGSALAGLRESLAIYEAVGHSRADEVRALIETLSRR